MKYLMVLFAVLTLPLIWIAIDVFIPKSIKAQNIVGMAGPGHEVIALDAADREKLHNAENWKKWADGNLATVRSTILTKYGQTEDATSPDAGCTKQVVTCTIIGDYVVRITTTENMCIPPEGTK